MQYHRLIRLSILCFSWINACLWAAPGDLDLGYHPNASGEVRILALQPNGHLLVGGGFSQIGGKFTSLARLVPGGQVDGGFNTSHSAYRALVVLPDGRILVGSSYGGMRCLLPGGGYVAGFNVTANGQINAIALQSDGRIILGGNFTTVNNTARLGLTRVNADGSLDMSFNPTVSSYGDVFTLLVLPDDRIIVGGNFTSVGGLSGTVDLARLSADGTPDPSFTPSTNGTVYCLAAQPDGKVLVGGNFGTVNGNTAFDYLARLNADGTLDLGFMPDPDGSVTSIALQTDGKMLIAGEFSSVGQVQRRMVARLLPDGSTDAVFDTNARETNSYSDAHGVTIQADGAVLVGGAFTSYDGVPRGRIARLENEVATQSLTLEGQTGLRWLRGGSSPEVSAVTFELSNDDGVSWSLLGTGTRIPGGWELVGLSLPTQGKVRAQGRTSGGYLNSSLGLVEARVGFGAQPEIVLEEPEGIDIPDGGSRDFGLVPVGTTGSRTFTIRNLGDAPLTGLNVSLEGPDAARFSIFTSPSAPLAGSGGSTTVTVNFTPTVPGERVAWLYITSNDPDEPVFDLRLSGTATSAPTVALSAAVNVTTTSATMRGTVAGNGLPTSVRFEWDAAQTYSTIHAASPSVVSSFTSQTVSAALFGLTPGTTYTYRLHAVNELGTTVVASRSFTTTAARVELPGDTLAAFPQVVEGTVYCTAVQPDGKMLVGGDLDRVNGLYVSTDLIRLNADGTHDASFSANQSYVQSVVVLPDGKILVGKDYGMVRLNANGSVDSGFAPAVNGAVHGISVMADGKIVIVGDFDSVGGAPSNYVARLLASGAKDPGFSASLNAETYGLAVQPDGKVLVAGRFTEVNGAARNWLARLNANGSTDSSFNPAVKTDISYVGNGSRCIIVQPDGNILVSGVLFGSGYDPRLRRFNADGTFDSTYYYPYSWEANSLSLQSNGNLIAVQHSYVERLYANSTYDSVFNNRVSGSSTIYSLSLLKSGRLLVGGSFTTFDGLAKQSLVLIENEAATESLTVPSAGHVLWQRGGTAPEAQYVTFELSSNQGASWSMLGTGTRVTGGWEITGASLPASGMLRARARVVSGMNNGSSGLIETLVAFGDQPVLVVANEVPEQLQSGVEQDFGLVALSSSVSRTFTIKNEGTAALTGVALTKTGEDPAAYTITQSPASTVAVGGSTSFTVQFTPTSGGTKRAVLHLAASSQVSGQPFVLVLTGNTFPILSVAQNQVPLPATGAAVNFGALPTQASVTRLFTVTNTGSRAATGLEAVVQGAAAADFVVQPLSPSLNVGQSLTFAVTFTPSATGLRSAVLTLQDMGSALAAPVDIALTGTAGGGAITQNMTGTTVGKPTWTRPHTGTPPTSLSSTTAPYDVVSFIVPVTGAYRVSCEAVNPVNWDLMLFLYGDGFNADAPLNYVLIGDDDSGVGYNSSFFTQLEAGRLYHLVVTGYGNGGAGSYALEVSSSQQELAVEYPVNTRLISGANTVDFGTVALSTSLTRRILIRNLGVNDLRGIQAFVEGPGAGFFQVKPVRRNTLTFEASDYVDVTYTPTAAGQVATATLRILSNDPVTPSFSVGLSGSSMAATYTMKLEEHYSGGDPKENGSTVNFGTVTIGSADETRYYWITNTGTGVLTELAVNVDGVASGDFVLIWLPQTTLAPGATTSFSLRFTPKAVGARSARLQVKSKQIPNPININLTGTGAAPTYALVVEEPYGVTRPSSHVIAFGEVPQEQPIERRFYIRNIGTGQLKNLTLTKSGAHASEFTLTPTNSSSLSKGNRLEVRVRCLANDLGAKTATVQISAEDLPANVTLQLSATVVTPAPKIVVKQPGVIRGQPETDALSSGLSEIHLPHTEVGVTSVQSFVIENAGSAPLSGLEIALSGTSIANYALTQPAVQTLEPGSSTTFTVSFTPSTAGQHSVALQIASNDSTQSPFDIGLSSTGFTGFPLQGTTQDAPRWQRPHDNGDAVPVSSVFATIPHEVVCFTVAETQVYEVRSSAVQGWDNFLCLYEGSFDASRPLHDVIASNDDYPHMGVSACNLTLEAGKIYYAVTTGYGNSSQGGYQLDVRAALPVISVEQPVGRSLQSGVSVVDFGQVALNDTRSLNVTIRNIGGASLNLGALEIDSPPTGTTGKYFTFQQPAVNTLGPNELVTVLVSFKPGAEGLLQGQLRIPSNDATRTPFIIELRGNCSRAMPIIGDMGSDPSLWETPDTMDFSPDYRKLPGLPYKDDFFSVRVSGNYRLGTCFRHYVGRIILCLYEVNVNSKGQVSHTRLIKAAGSMTGEVYLDNCPLVAGKFYCLRTSGSTGAAPGDYLVTIEPLTVGTQNTHPVVLGGIKITLDGSPNTLEDNASTIHIGHSAYLVNITAQPTHRTCMITNTGAVDLIIHGIRVEGNDIPSFKVLTKNGKPWPTSAIRITKGASVTFQISFQARRVGYHTAQIILTTNLSGSLREFTIHVEGNGLSGDFRFPRFTLLAKPQLILANATARFTASVVGSDPLKLQWLKGSAAIKRATGSTLVLSNVKPSDAGIFRLQATNKVGQFGGIAVSSPTFLGVVSRPPATRSVVSGNDLTLTCAVSAPREVLLSYQWYHRGVALTDDGLRIFGATSSKLIIKNIRVTEWGAYHCAVTMSPALSRFTFSPVSLTNTATQVIVVVKPVLDPISLPELYVGQPIQQNITALNLPTSYTVSGGLPPGVTLNKTTGLLSGKPTVVITEPFKEYTLTFTASNLAGPCLEPKRVVWKIKRLPLGTTGTYSGLVDRFPTLAPGLGGSFSATITPSGKMSGKIRLSSTDLPFTGILDVPASGTEVHLPETPIKRGSAIVLWIQFTIHLGTGELTGHVRDGVSGPCPLQAWRAETADLADYTAKYNSGLLPPENVLEDSVHFPQGEGYTILSLTNKGTATWTGRLGDGTAITGASILGMNGRLPLFTLLHKNTGSLHGWSTINPSTGHLDGVLTWRKFQPTVHTQTRSYKHGIPLHSLVHQGSRYQAPISGLILGITPPTSASTANTWMTFQHGALDADFTQPTQMSLKHSLTAVTPVLNALKPAFSVRTGILSGSFIIKNADPKKNRPGTLSGIIVPRLGRACGHHLLPLLPTNVTETVSKTDILSGLMMMNTSPPLE